MAFISVSDHFEIRILTFARGKANAMNLAMVDELLEAVRHVAGDERVRAVVNRQRSARILLCRI